MNFNMFVLCLFYIYLLFNHFLCDVLAAASASSIRNPSSILDESKCVELKTFCGNVRENIDFLILECLLSQNPARLNSLHKDCQNIIWERAGKLIQDESVKNILQPVCQSDLYKLKCKDDGNYLRCVVNNLNDVNANCYQMIVRLENLAFTDYRWISGFLVHCKEDIQITKCGRFDPQSFSQMKTVSCLQDNILKVKDECKREILHLSELQSDNIKLDAQLYLDCTNDHMRYCPQLSPGSGRVFSCLMQQMHKDSSKLAINCKDNLFRRQKLIAQDYHISKGLLKACREDIKKTHCRKQISNDKTVRLAQILLCLENVIKNGIQIDPKCEAELTEHRRMLMEDYRLSPEIVNDCKSEINTFCKGIEQGGKTIHCLMDRVLSKARNTNIGIENKCLEALGDLVKETDVGENWNVDPVLNTACEPVVKVACRGMLAGDARIQSCLMDHLGTDYMNDECESALLQIQYFVARDFKLDPQLYKACKNDAIKNCNFKGNDDIEEGFSHSPDVLPCLYRYAYIDKDDLKLNDKCVQQIRRVMRQRAVSVDLQPEIEEVCINELSLYCQNKIKKGEEMQCLQDKLEEIEGRCHDAVEMFTEIEAQHVELNPYVSKYCSQFIDSLCKTDSSNDEGGIMDCLIEHKNNPLIKSHRSCRASIEHFQLISIKDYRFTYKFKVACKAHAQRLCRFARTKNEVIACLSEQILNSTLNGVKSSILKDCKQQLKAQILQQRENIMFDPVLKKACSADINQYCNVEPGNSQVLECLQSLPRGKLSKKCEKEIFSVQKLEVEDNSLDYALLTMCADVIDQFCPNHPKESILNCLKVNKDEKGFTKKCHMIVMHRIAEQTQNYLLNPSLQQNCHMDIKKFCSNVDTENEKYVDSVVKCLKVQFRSSKLSNTCEKEIAEILREQALDVNINPLIKVLCKNELETICKFKEDESVKAEECLKTSFLNKNIQTPECRLEVANMIEESQVDIQADPLLQRACALDLLTFCNDLSQGNGRHIQCLRTVLESSTHDLTSNCKNKLNERFVMYKNAANLRDFGDLYQQVTLSPSKNYFVVVVLMFIAGTFVTGILCGRVTRSKYRLLKNK